MPRSIRCRSLHSCEITYVHPVFPRSPYRVRYRIVGEQLSGCWMAWRQVVLDPVPYEDAGRGPAELAGCGSCGR